MIPTYVEIRKLIERRYRRQVIWGVHLTIFVFLFMVLGWWVITREPVPGDMQHMWLLATWFAALVAHGFIVRVMNARDHEIEQAWKHYGGKHLSMHDFDAGDDNRREKAKRKLHLDDGELLDMADDADTFEPRRKVK